MSISQLFVLSPRGDVLVFKDFKGNINKTSTEVFIRKTKQWNSQAKVPPPVFQSDGVQYIHVSLNNLYWVATTRENVSPSLVTELLMRIYWIITDYVGYISEDAVRQNFVLVYELLDEIMDYGYPQNSSTERLKQFIAMEPVVSKPRPASLDVSKPNEVVKSVLDTARTGAKEEIFVDIVEKLTAIFDAGGHLRSSGITGSIQLKSYLNGNPVIRLGLSDNLVLGNQQQQQDASSYGSGYGTADSVVLDTYSLHEAVDQERFIQERVLELVPPEGHFALLTYRSSRSFRPPFRVYTLIEDDMYTSDKLTLYLRIRAEYEPTKIATGIEVTVPLPPCVQRVNCDSGNTTGGAAAILSQLPGSKGVFQSFAEWNQKDNKLVWILKNVQGGKEYTLQARLTVEVGAVEMTKRDYGPIMLQFVLPGKPSHSGLDVKYMKIAKDEKGYNPSRWFRVVALGNSYQIRTT